MNQEFNLEDYLTSGVEWLVKDAIRTTLKNPRESTFLAKYALASKKANTIRHKLEMEGEHIPPFLIASITSTCNLHCKGCYARANHSCGDQEDKKQLSEKEWDKIFKESAELGIAFILLAGGEPLIRKDVIEAAAQYKNIIFPVFTNGTMINKDYLTVFNQNRNLIPVISMEGGEISTDDRRGNGIYQTIINSMESMKEKGILFGTSITVTKDNMTEVTDKAYLDNLYQHGCKLVFFVEYVPVDEQTGNLAPDDRDREYMEERLNALRETASHMIYISFPGDEKASGGCLAAGRGFFHINAHGGAEPCPFSPYSDTNMKNTSLKEALKSPLFQKLKENHSLLNEHTGGCALFEQQEFVESLLR
ncbi:MAG: radical domain protein [Anaerocolumna sp.]|nr:radical domain protein [Anaerocolumna sp.]